MRLQPSGDLFEKCYPEWTKSVAQLVVGSPNGTSFGLYAQWGAGKSSACEVIARAAYAAAHAHNKIIQIVTLNAYELRSASLPGFVAAANRELVLGLMESPQNTRKGKALFDLLARLGPAVATALGIHHGAPAAGALGSSAVKTLTETGLAHADKQTEAEARRIVQDLDLDKVIIIFDDLDRCPPEQAISILSHCADPIAAQVANVVIACDPEILAAHAASAFGVPRLAGLEAISKYIHAPLHLPTGLTDIHQEVMSSLISNAQTSIRTALVKAAGDAVGVIPIREIRAALPQTRLWAERAVTLYGEERATKYVRQLLYIALLSGILPEIVRVAQWSPKNFNALADLVRVGPTANKSDMGNVLAVFGNSVIDSIRHRPDLSMLGQRLWGGADATKDDVHHLAYLIGAFRHPVEEFKQNLGFEHGQKGAT